MPPLDMDADAPPGGVRVHASLPGSEGRGRLATIVSFLLHALIIYIAIRLTAVVTMPDHSPLGDVIQLALGGGGGGGGQGGAAFEHPVAPPPPPTPVVTPLVQPPSVPPPAPPQSVPPPAAPANPQPARTVAAAGSGTGSGGGSGSGTGTGTGSGQGPGSGSGGGKGGSPPVPHSYIVPQLNAPKKLHGKTVEVTFHVGTDGHVTDISVVPPIEDRAYAKKFDEVVRDFRFMPARDANGTPIAGITTMEFTF